jgi:tRNA(Ile)-lysidine synthase
MFNKFNKIEKSGQSEPNFGQILKSGDRIINGLSGGPDSVYLTYLLYNLRDEKKLTLFLAHVNYKLRGEESDADEDFCRALAKKLGLPIEVKIADLRGLKSSAGNVQAVAREKRMEFFDYLAKEYDCNKIALGHTLDDNVETVLANIFRGSGLEGLSGIAAISGRIIRPLLNTSKAEITEHLDKSEIPYRIDSTNLESDYTRNKIRNLILPEIREQINPKVNDALLRLAAIVSEAAKFFGNLIEKFCGDHVSFTSFGSAIIPLGQFSLLDPILKKYLLRFLAQKILGKNRGKIEFDLISSAIGLINSGTGGRADLGAGVMLEKAAQSLVIFMPAREIEAQDVEIPGKTVLKGFDLILHSKADDSPGEINRETDNWTVKLDMGEAGNKFYVRQYRQGDYFQPLGMSSAKKLSDFFIDRKIPRALRAEIPLLVCGEEIVWVMGHEISEHYRIGPSPVSPLKLWVEKVVKKVE